MLLVLAFVLIGLVWLHVRDVDSRLEGLRSTVFTQGLHLRDVQVSVQTLQRTPNPVVPPPVQPPPPAAEPAPFTPPATPAFRPAAAEKNPEDQPKPKPEPVSARVFKPVAAAPSFTQRIETSGGWEAVIGGNLLNKLGALILVIGVALFLSYSFQHMGPGGIALTAIAFSAATLVAGILVERRERYRDFSRGLIAAGWAGLYCAAYAMYAVPAAKVIDSPVAGMFLMTLVAAGMVAHSLRYRVQSLTSLAFGCVFGALAISDQNALVAFALVPLAASMLFLARRFQWYGMGLFSAAATYATFLTRPSTGTPLVQIQLLLLIFWLLFETFDLLRVNAGVEEWPRPGAMSALNAFAGLGASAAVWYRLAPDSMWQFCCGAAVLYLASTWIRFAMQGHTLYEFSLTISALFAGLAIFAGVPGMWISLGVMAEAEVLFLAGFYLNLRFARFLSMLAFAAAALQLAGRNYAAPTAILGTSVHVSIDAWAPPLVVFALVFYFNRGLAKQSRYFGYIASACLTLVMSVELPWRYAGAAALLYGVLLLEFGIRRDLFDFRLQGYWVAALGAIGAGFSFLDPQLARNGWTYGTAAALSLSIAIRAARSLAFLPEMERRAMRIGGASAAAGLTAVLCTRLFPESYWGIAILGVSIACFELAWAALPSEMLLPAVAVNVAGIGGLVWEHAAGIQQHPEQSVWIGFLGAALVYYYLSARLLRNTSPERVPLRIIAPALGSAFALATIYMLVPTPYVCMAFGALALLVAEAGTATEAPDLVWNGRAVSLLAAASLTGLAYQPGEAILANCAMLAAIHLILLFRLRKLRFADVHGYLASLIVAGALFHQVSGGMLTLSWSPEGIGLLALGFAARERSLRLSGLTVLLLCVGKVFFYDLRNLETLYRILSFIGLGAILLLVSWIYTRFKDQFRKFL